MKEVIIFFLGAELEYKFTSHILKSFKILHKYLGKWSNFAETPCRRFSVKYAWRRKGFASVVLDSQMRCLLNTGAARYSRCEQFSKKPKRRWPDLPPSALSTWDIQQFLFNNWSIQQKPVQQLTVSPTALFNNWSIQQFQIQHKATQQLCYGQFNNKNFQPFKACLRGWI